MRAVARRLRRWLSPPMPIRESVADYFARHQRDASAGRYETVHPAAVAHNPLPRNMSADALPADPGWWGYAFRDVPARLSGETFIATIPDAIVTWYRDPARADDFYPAVVTRDGTALDLREIRFRPPHLLSLRASGRRMRRATWVTERVYHNHSHWLTAHLPKLLLLKGRGALGDVLLPPERSSSADRSLALAGMPVDAFGTFPQEGPLHVEELTIVGTDRFRPELLRLVPEAYRVEAPGAGRRIFISRAGATRRRLLNEEELWPILEACGFERVRMEDLPFDAQVDLMRQTGVLVAPHGAGLTNMLFCPEGSHVVELASLSFPNPNFYALASALRHRYWLVDASAHGDVQPLEQDLHVDPARLREVLTALEEAAG